MLQKPQKTTSRMLGVVFLSSVALLVLNKFLMKNETIELLLTQVMLATALIPNSLPLIKSTIISYPKARNRFNMKLWRYAINTRKYYKLTPINNFILHVGSILALTSISIFILFKPSNTSFMFAPAIIMSISFTIDFYNRAKYLIKKIWSSVLGKGIMTLLATLSFIISKFLARHWICATTNIDPKYFPDFNSIVVLFFTPVTYFILIGIISIILVIPEFIVVNLASILPTFKLITPYKTRIKLKKLLVRLRTGKRFEKLKSSEVALLKSNIIYFRILSAFLFFIIISYSFSSISKITGSFLDSTARLGLVNYYYNNDEVKSNQPYIKYYNYDGEKRSQAFYKEGRWEFSLKDKKIHERL